MNFIRVTGPAFTATCKACGKHTIAGDQPYRSASRGDQREPEKVYADLDGKAFESYYCEACAAKLRVEDPTRAVNQYFSDTSGQEIKPPEPPLA